MTIWKPCIEISSATRWPRRRQSPKASTIIRPSSWKNETSVNVTPTQWREHQEDDAWTRTAWRSRGSCRSRPRCVDGRDEQLLHEPDSRPHDRHAAEIG